MKESYIEKLENCKLCPRMCGVNRLKGEKGFCGVTGKDVFVARAGLHKWEEPCISGNRGSGTVFFTGCNLRCIYCQNREISRGQSLGISVSVSRLAEIFTLRTNNPLSTIRSKRPSIASTIMRVEEVCLSRLTVPCACFGILRP